MGKSIIFLAASLLTVLIFAAQYVGAENKAAASLSDKDVLKVLMGNLDVKLSDSAHCEGVGIDEHDQTIGDYLSGFWSFHTARQGNNWIEVATTEESPGHQRARVMIYREHGEENWGWGVSFVIDNEQTVDRTSFVCLGAG